MRKFTIAFAALIAASPAMAGDLIPVTKIVHIYTATADEPLSLAEQTRRNTAHERQTYERIVSEGGCNADFNTVEYATYCHAGTFGAPQMGSND
jgi:hypothetical protein